MIRARQALTYQVGFPLLRELACTLSKLLHEPNKENKSRIISWKWVLACQIWAKLLSANDHLYFACLKVLKKSQKFNHAILIEEKKDFPLRMLGYPFMNIAMGSFSWAQANPSLVPFQLQILHVLDVLLEAKPAFTKVDSLLTSNDGFPKFSLFVSYGILSILELIHDKTRPSKKLLQLPNEIKHCLSMPDAFLATRLYSDAILVEAMSLLKKDFIRAADHIAFPEAIFLLQAKLKQLAKKTKNAALHKPLLALLKTVQLHTDWMMDWRKNTLKASPFDLASGIIKEINQSDVRKDTAAPETKPNAKKMVPLPMNGLQFVNAAGFSLKKGPLFA